MNIKKCLLTLLTMIMLSPAFAVIDTYQFNDAEQQQRFFILTNELRCPKCQNQSIADSNAPIAQDLRREVHRLLLDGADDQKIIAFMLDRYGDFVLYRPRLDSKTAILWFGPFVLLMLGVISVLMIVRKHRAGNRQIDRKDKDDEHLSTAQQEKLKAILAQESGRDR